MTPSIAPQARGTLITRTIPGTTSRFAARRAVIYLPPILRKQPHLHLPLLVLLHGVPGGPADWTELGGLPTTADTFAATHGGRAPIVVMPDINGSPHSDSECIEVRGASVERYLTVDLPRWVLSHLPVSADRRHWAVGGVSEGGTCALILSLRHPAMYPTFVDLSGLSRPTAARHDDPAQTIATLFGGSRAAYDAHDPLWLLARQRYPQLAGWLACGWRDDETCTAQAVVASAAQRAGIAVAASALPGAHGWTLWSRAFAPALPWLWRRMSS
jgi:S-formylglutathione hydrolase FrmB